MDRGRPERIYTDWQSQVIEADRTGEPYELTVEMSSNDTFRNIVQHGGPIVDYCTQFGINSLIATVDSSGYSWTFFAADTNKQHFHDKAQAEKLIRGAREVIFFDNEGYSDTRQLGMSDEWFRNNVRHYDVSSNGIEISNIAVARKRMRVTDGGSFNLDGTPVSSYDWEYEGEATQLVNL